MSTCPSVAPTRSKLRDYLTLTKPEVNLLVVMTTSAAYYLASGDRLDWMRLLHCVLGTLLVASGTATLNQFMERRYDSGMRRTAARPLPSGRVSPLEALWFGLALSVLLYILSWTTILVIHIVAIIKALGGSRLDIPRISVYASRF